ncbi:hypothetical protein AZE42_06597 [Rhizopogon vesiculosus]|uniref:RlpA-like protein double-psi beta-barrel domain-containing protein n=1 Tax=Rhizopogon vesiculosus TaxID=180088 RepID=A0A1J8R7M8_9AGAM|nr:hypothetical protein AZE42_06597 [Rhizopogon vesiculosus]
MLASSIFLFVSTILPFTSGSTHAHIRRDSHQEVARRARSNVNVHKRGFDNTRFTFYDVGLGACGQYSSPGDFIVALNVDQYGGGYPGPQCFKSITISYGGKTAQATIMDECMGCPYGGLDFSVGLFQYFASEADGVLYGSWWFNDGSDQTTTTSSYTWTPDPTPTPTPTPTTQETTSSSTTTSYSTTSTTPTTSESSTSTTSISSTSSTSNTTSLAPVNVNTGVASGIAVPTGTAVVDAPSIGNPQNLLVINNALVVLGVMLTTQRGS